MRICKHCGSVVKHYRDNLNRVNRICEHGITSTVMAGSRCPSSKKPLSTHSEERDEEAKKLDNGYSDVGRYAVAVVGTQGWSRDSAIGDGITSAFNALVGRYRKMSEAKAEADRLNYAQPSFSPGSNDVFVFQAKKYDITDYIGSQALHCNGSRPCDRRIACPQL